MYCIYDNYYLKYEKLNYIYFNLTITLIIYLLIDVYFLFATSPDFNQLSNAKLNY